MKSENRQIKTYPQIQAYLSELMENFKDIDPIERRYILRTLIDSYEPTLKQGVDQ